MKEQILKLRAEGKSYREIEKILNCSKGTIAYHCGKGQKEKTRERDKSAGAQLSKKLFAYKARKEAFRKVSDFQRKRSSGAKRWLGGREFNFTLEDLLNKIGEEPKCYLTGRVIDLSKPNSYSLDHITPICEGGDCSLENLGLTSADANSSKAHLKLEDYLELCKDVLETHGYKVEKL